MLRASFVYLFIALYVLIAGPIGIIGSLLSGRTDFVYGLARLCMRLAGWMSGIRLVIRGQERILPDRTYLFLSNHQSNFDGPILLHTTGRNLRAIVKTEMMRIPLLSMVLRRVQFVPIDRKDPVQARAGLDRAAQLLRNGFSFFAFPEGTRSRDGFLGQFKKGVFVMAIQAGMPVVPVSIRNSRALQLPGRYGIRPATVEVAFHDPIDTCIMKLEDRDYLLRLTREAILRGLDTAAAGGR
jgi:1-acyl-sn-glycerol-3-phosphate acyltransferase